MFYPSPSATCAVMKAQFAFAILLLCASLAFSAYPAVKVELFAMAKCPYCAQWAESFDKNVLAFEDIAEIVSLDIQYVARDNGNGDFSCLHGPGECVGDQYVLCAKNVSQSSDKFVPDWWTMASCMDEDQSKIPFNSKVCATNAGLSWPAISDCYTSKLGATLFAESIAVCEKMGVNSTPTIFVNGKEYDGNNMLKEICAQYTGPKPSSCNNA